MLSVSESAEILGVSTARVRALIADGALPARKIGRAWALREEDVMQRRSLNPKSGRPPLREDAPMPAEPDARVQARDLSRLYRECKEAFRFRPSVDEIGQAESQEEAAFYIAVADFFLKRRQAELVKAGVY